MTYNRGSNPEPRASEEAALSTPPHHTWLVENKMKADFSHFRRFGSVYGDGSEASTMTTYRFRINDGDIIGGEGRGGGSPEPAYNETKASILRRRNTMAKMIHEEEQAAIQVSRILNF